MLRAQTIKYFLLLCLGLGLISIVYVGPQNNIKVSNFSHMTIEEPDIEDLVSKQASNFSHMTIEEPDIEDLVEKCMEVTHIDSVIPLPSLIKDAKSNAKYLYQEFGKVIPQSPLEGYRSYCWYESYSLKWDSSNFSGHIGNMSYNDYLRNLRVYALNKKLSILDKTFPQHSFNSSIVCLPKLFLIGFHKCGTTFVTCWVHHLISLTAYDSRALSKEPQFWTSPNIKFNFLTANDLGRYFFYFLRGLQAVSESKRRDVFMMDSNVGNIYDWPKFKPYQHNLTNYCLLPSVLPKLLPGSKYIVIMRNPISMLYTRFWYSCTSMGIKVPMTTQLKGPDIFHNRVVTKIGLFNDCMRNSSIPSISHACEIGSQHNYTSCILQPERMKLIDKCTQEINFLTNDSQMPNCGHCFVDISLYFVHIRKWLSTIPREHFHFIILEDWIQDPLKKSRDLLMFLNLTADAVADESLKNAANGCSTFSQNVIKYKDNPKLEMRTDTKEILDLFYKPFNLVLAQLLSIPNLW